MIISNNMNDIYKQIWNEVKNEEIIGNTRELQNKTFILTNPLNSFISIRDTSIKYCLAELVWYFSYSNDVDFIGKYASMWQRLSDDGITSNSAYGYIINKKYFFDQIEHVVNQLKIDPNSRRAKININRANIKSIETKDEPCTMFLQFLIRDGKLNMTTVMRSNDIWFGLPYDVVYFTTIQRVIAQKLNVELGTYTHFATSIHYYLRDEEKIRECIEKDDTTEYDVNIRGIELASAIRIAVERDPENIVNICDLFGLSIKPRKVTNTLDNIFSESLEMLEKLGK